MENASCNDIYKIQLTGELLILNIFVFHLQSLYFRIKNETNAPTTTQFNFSLC